MRPKCLYIRNYDCDNFIRNKKKLSELQVFFDQIISNILSIFQGLEQ